MPRKIFFLPSALLALFVAASTFAGGEFDYLAIEGPGIIGELNVTNPALTRDFFAFADFSQGEVPAPADPGQGYQIARVYVEVADSKPTDLPFDVLDYYPYTGYVFYKGLVNGVSEYDGKWYAANPAAEAPFRNALFQRALLTWIPFGVLVVMLIWFAVAYYKKPAG
ncbi:MAG: hypothetical protein DCC59_12205 [Chloroflexi bacterium]|nr:hypothetical protein [Chloroflexi bacterium CFX1]MCK6566378.1 hypothetical protein [Anaerolineales bacterium]MCQ3953000.1 hypothetical protein [Chloroflexota bacterium]MDL1919513.1 hypothetical protein [Chloroflexi bacterium CFX5]NUQ58630.1 hypothetical protein [Anaerolineales bacterium]